MAYFVEEPVRKGTGQDLKKVYVTIGEQSELLSMLLIKYSYI